MTFVRSNQKTSCNARPAFRSRRSHLLRRAAATGRSRVAASGASAGRQTEIGPAVDAVGGLDTVDTGKPRESSPKRPGTSPRMWPSGDWCG